MSTRKASDFAARYGDGKRVAWVFRSSRIRQRYAVCPIESQSEPLGSHGDCIASGRAGF
jgi:hypothetical protein